HQCLPEAQFVYNSWLGAGGDFSAIKQAVIRWLHQHYQTPEAVFVTKFLVRQKDLTPQTIQEILAWCRQYAADPDAVWRLSRLDEHLLNPEISEALCATAKSIVHSLCASESVPAFSKGQMLVLSWLSEAPAFCALPLKQRRNSLFRAWLHYPAAFDFQADDFLQRPHYLYWLGHAGGGRCTAGRGGDSALFTLGGSLDPGKQGGAGGTHAGVQMLFSPSHVVEYSAFLATVLTN
ncbi:MAG: hypothetical protein GY862_22340, partial [Gammaproteobacteria bacterium]|nr:hypothetical protein [Gammaproteobacteria bacterium]